MKCPECNRTYRHDFVLAKLVETELSARLSIRYHIPFCSYCQQAQAEQQINCLDKVIRECSDKELDNQRLVSRVRNITN